jgi:hypothetical protein
MAPAMLPDNFDVENRPTRPKCQRLFSLFFAPFGHPPAAASQTREKTPFSRVLGCCDSEATWIISWRSNNLGVNYTEILSALREFTFRARIEFLPLAPDARPVSNYTPIQKYVLDLKNVVKPETAAEDLFTALCKDVLGFQPTRQVGSREGWVDFMLPEPRGEPLPLELKPLLQRDGPDALWRNDANPRQHVAQVKKYLRDHEYLILADLRTAWFFSARDFFFENKPFAELPFAEFFARCRETGSMLDTIRRIEDTAEKPELEQQFFEDLKIWFNEFDKVKWTPTEQAAESIILLINKLIFARTIEDYGLVQYRFTQDEYSRFSGRLRYQQRAVCWPGKGI